MPEVGPEAMAPFATASLQASIWTPDLSLSGARLIRTLPAEWFEFFDAEPQPLPIPNDAPREITRLLLSDSTGSWRCEISFDRFSVFWTKSSEDALASSLPKFFEKAIELQLGFRRQYSARVARMAGLVSRFAYSEAPSVFLAKHFCRDNHLESALKRPENFELHAHKRYELGGRIRVNSWVRCKTGNVRDGGNAFPIVLVEQDLNTLSELEGETNYSDPEIVTFFGLLAEEFDAILGRYFPEGVTSEHSTDGNRA